MLHQSQEQQCDSRRCQLSKSRVFADRAQWHATVTIVTAALDSKEEWEQTNVEYKIGKIS